MRSVDRRGFTLIELVVVLGLMGIILGALYQSILATQRTTTTQLQRIDLQQTTRAAALYMSNMARELDAAEGDILQSQGTLLQFRAMRWTGILCSIPFEAAGQVQFTMRGDLLYGVRGPDAALDSILLYWEGDPSIRVDDVWRWEHGRRCLRPCLTWRRSSSMKSTIRVIRTASCRGITRATSRCAAHGWKGRRWCSAARHRPWKRGRGGIAFRWSRYRNALRHSLCRKWFSSTCVPPSG